MLNTQNAASTVAHIIKADAAPAVAHADKPEAKKVQRVPKAPRKSSKNSAADAVIANIAKATRSTMVTVGGTEAEPEKVDAADFPRVTLAELNHSGSTMQALAFNFLAGSLDNSITVEAMAELPRALRNEKTAILRLLGHKAADIRARWESEQAKRKRKDKPTLRALAALFAVKKAGPTKTWKEKVAEIVNSRRSADMKLQMLKELIAE